MEWSIIFIILHSEAHRTGIRHQSKIASGNQYANRLFKLLIHIKLRLSMNYILTECIESANQTASLAYNFIRLNQFKWNLFEILQICYYLIFYQALKSFSVYLFLAYLKDILAYETLEVGVTGRNSFSSKNWFSLKIRSPQNIRSLRKNCDLFSLKIVTARVRNLQFCLKFLSI